MSLCNCLLDEEEELEVVSLASTLILSHIVNNSEFVGSHGFSHYRVSTLACKCIVSISFLLLLCLNLGSGRDPFAIEVLNKLWTTPTLLRHLW